MTATLSIIMSDRWITAKEFAGILGVSPSYLRVLKIRYQDFPPAIKLGGTNVYDSAEALAYARDRKSVDK